MRKNNIKNSCLLINVLGFIFELKQISNRSNNIVCILTSWILCSEPIWIVSKHFIRGKVNWNFNSSVAPITVFNKHYPIATSKQHNRMRIVFSIGRHQIVKHSYYDSVAFHCCIDEVKRSTFTWMDHFLISQFNLVLVNAVFGEKLSNG